MPKLVDNCTKNPQNRMIDTTLRIFGNVVPWVFLFFVVDSHLFRKILAVIHKVAVPYQSASVRFMYLAKP